MITSGFTYLAVIVFFASLIIGLENQTKSKFFEYVPAIVLIYFAVMLLFGCSLQAQLLIRLEGPLFSGISK